VCGILGIADIVTCIGIAARTMNKDIGSPHRDAMRL
jgi:hypothetical protein